MIKVQSRSTCLKIQQFNILTFLTTEVWAIPHAYGKSPIEILILPRYEVIQIKCGALYKNISSTDKDFCLLRIFPIENTIPIGPPTKKFMPEFFVGTKKLSKSALKTKCYTIGFEKIVADQNTLSLTLQKITARPKEKFITKSSMLFFIFQNINHFNFMSIKLS